VDWSPGYDLALEEAILTRRPVLVFFTASWCLWCRKLEGTTLRDPAVAALLQHCVPVRVDGDKEKGTKALHRVTGYPTVVLLSRRGEEIARITGYLKPEAFARTLEAGLLRRENLAQAEARVEAEPENPQAFFALGDVRLALGEYATARQAFLRAGELDRNLRHDLADDAELEAGVALLMGGEDDAAVEALEGFLQRYPDHERRDEGLFFYGVALIATGHQDAGLRRITEAASITSMEYIRFEAKRIRETLKEGRG
jgi:tetratricopeptide (TPR) repeat protein